MYGESGQCQSMLVPRGGECSEIKEREREREREKNKTRGNGSSSRHARCVGSRLFVSPETDDQSILVPSSHPSPLPLHVMSGTTGFVSFGLRMCVVPDSQDEILAIDLGGRRGLDGTGQVRGTARTIR